MTSPLKKPDQEPDHGHQFLDPHIHAAHHRAIARCLVIWDFITHSLKLAWNTFIANAGAIALAAILLALSDDLRRIVAAWLDKAP